MTVLGFLRSLTSLLREVARAEQDARATGRGFVQVHRRADGSLTYYQLDPAWVSVEQPPKMPPGPPAELMVWRDADGARVNSVTSGGMLTGGWGVPA